MSPISWKSFLDSILEPFYETFLIPLSLECSSSFASCCTLQVYDCTYHTSSHLSPWNTWQASGSQNCLTHPRTARALESTCHTVSAHQILLKENHSWD